MPKASDRKKKVATLTNPVPHCVHCGAAVREIGGVQILGGNAANWRHQKPPVGCPKGDPLLDSDVN